MSDQELGLIFVSIYYVNRFDKFECFQQEKFVKWIYFSEIFETCLLYLYWIMLDKDKFINLSYRLLLPVFTNLANLTLIAISKLPCFLPSYSECIKWSVFFQFARHYPLVHVIVMADQPRLSITRLSTTSSWHDCIPFYTSTLVSWHPLHCFNEMNLIFVHGTIWR